MYSWPHRTYCETLSEMRHLIKTINIFTYYRVKSMLLSLVEENQVYGNRMEAGLEYEGDLEKLHKKRKDLLEEVKSLKAEKKELEESLGKKQEEDPRLSNLRKISRSVVIDTDEDE